MAALKVDFLLTGFSPGPKGRISKLNFDRGSKTRSSTERCAPSDAEFQSLLRKSKRPARKAGLNIL